jgi:hypothetical protein
VDDGKNDSGAYNGPGQFLGRSRMGYDKSTDRQKERTLVGEFTRVIGIVCFGLSPAFRYIRGQFVS